MAAMQEQLAVRVKGLSDEKASRVMKFIDKLEENKTTKDEKKELTAKRKAYRRFLKARKEMAPLPEDFDYKKELEKARVEKYENLG